MGIGRVPSEPLCVGVVTLFVRSSALKRVPLQLMFLHLRMTDDYLGVFEAYTWRDLLLTFVGRGAALVAEVNMVVKLSTLLALAALALKLALSGCVTQSCVFYFSWPLD